jgi:hypothetical protein
VSLVWSNRRPSERGWFWIKWPANGLKTVEIVFFDPASYRVIVGDRSVAASSFHPKQWAGPIAQPKEPNRQQLAAIRYQLYGTYLPPRTHYWGANPGQWEFVDRAEILQRVRRHLTGCYHEDSGGEADSSEVTLYSSAKRNGRWVALPGEIFTATTIDAAIAAEQAKNLPAGHRAAGIVEANGQHGSAAMTGAPVTAGAAEGRA